MNFFQPAPSCEERVGEPFGLAEMCLCFNLLKRAGGGSGYKAVDGCRGRQPSCRDGTESLHGGPDDQRDSCGDRAFGACRRQWYLRPGQGIPPGRHSNTNADRRHSGGDCESGCGFLDPASAGSAVSPVAPARIGHEGKALRKASSCHGDPDPGSGWARDLDPPDGASGRGAPAVQDSGELPLTGSALAALTIEVGWI